jgi:hypothetical protein
MADGPEGWPKRDDRHPRSDKTEPNPGMIQSIEEISLSEMSVGALRKRHRVRNLAAELRQKRKERTRGYRGSRRKVAASCRKLSGRARVAWQKRNTIRNIRTLEKCGRRKGFAAAGIRTTRCAKVARHMGRSHEGPSVEQGRRKDQTKIKFATGTRQGWTFERTLQVDPEGSTGGKDPNTRRQLRLSDQKTAGPIFEKNFRLQIAKLEDGSSVGLLKIRNWTLWRGRPPPKRKKLHIEEEPIM